MAELVTMEDCINLCAAHYKETDITRHTMEEEIKPFFAAHCQPTEVPSIVYTLYYTTMCWLELGAMEQLIGDDVWVTALQGHINTLRAVLELGQLLPTPENQ